MPVSWRREELDKARPCFHCSRVLSYRGKGRARRYFAYWREVDGFERSFHLACLEEFLASASREATR